MDVSENVVASVQKTIETRELDLLRLMIGPPLQRSLCFVTRLGIPDLLAECPMNANELAVRTHTHANSLYRILRALASLNFFTMSNDGTFGLNALSDLLRKDAPGSMRDFALMVGTDWYWNAWGRLDQCVTTGVTAQKLVYGQDVFDYLKENREMAEIFNRAMTSFTMSSIPFILDSYDFSDIRSLVDVGGGHGILLARLLRTYPQMKGILYDLPSVIDHAEPAFLNDGVRDRVDLVAGDFFKEVPQGADAYLLKFIIHDWDDTANNTILKNIAHAMHKDSRVLIVESIVPEGNEPSIAKLRDLQMLLLTGGRERTETEFRYLLQEAGLSVKRIYVTGSMLSVIEGVKN